MIDFYGESGRVMMKSEAINREEGVKVVEQLLVGADAMLMEAEVAIEQKDEERESLYTAHTVSVFKALQSGLDGDQGGKIAETLHDLYDYMIERVMTGFQVRDRGYVEEVRGILKSLIEGWSALGREDFSPAAA